MLQTGRNPATPGDELVVGHCSAELGGGFTVSSWENRKLNQTASQTLIIKRISHSDEPNATQPSVTGDIWVEE